MKQEKFNPSDKTYKKVADLPPVYQKEFTDVDGGFVKKTALKETKMGKPIYGERESWDNSLQEDAINLSGYIEERDWLINDAPQIIREGGFDKGLVPVAEQLGIKVEKAEIERAQKRARNILNTTEDLLYKVLQITNNFDKDASPLLEAVTDSFIKIEGISYNGWSHSACHLIEQYGSYGKGTSFLDTAQSREILTKLVDESVARRKREQQEESGCSTRIIWPIMEYNLTEAGISNLEQPYVYRPESLRDSEYFEILKKNELSAVYDSKYSPEEAFLKTNSPLEYYRFIIEKGDEMPRFLSPKQQIELLQSLEKYISPDLINDFVKRAYNPNGESIAYNELLKNFKESKESHDISKGIYVDVEGTLIKSYAGKRSLKENLVEQLEEFITKGLEIVIFTGGDVVAVEAELKKLGFPEHFLPIRAKSAYKGKVLEVLIDDTPPEYQGFKALELHNPEYYVSLGKDSVEHQNEPNLD